VSAGGSAAYTRIRMPTGWMWSLRYESLAITRNNLRMGATNWRSLLSRHTQEIKNDRCRLSCLSKIAHNVNNLGLSCFSQHRLKLGGPRLVRHFVEFFTSGEAEPHPSDGSERRTVSRFEASN
jgi:hypothetical protein